MTAQPSAVQLGQPGSTRLLDGGAVTQSWHDVAEQLWLAAIPGWVDPGSENPGDIPGHGLIPAQVARQIAADAHWRMWITDAQAGRVVATNARTYRPAAAVARLVRAREPF